MFSFLIKIAINDNRAVLDDITTRMLGLTFDKVEAVIVEADSIKNYVIINDTFFFF